MREIVFADMTGPFLERLIGNNDWVFVLDY